PGHVHRDEVGPDPRDGSHRTFLDPARDRAPRTASLDGRLTRGGEQACERAAVKRLLVEPAGEEGRHVRIVDDARPEQLAHVDHRVALDVLHVAQRAQRVGAEGNAATVVPRDPLEVDRTWARCPAVDGGLVHDLTYGPD